MRRNKNLKLRGLGLKMKSVKNSFKRRESRKSSKSRFKFSRSLLLRPKREKLL
jgi:hypothetical protein